MGNHSLLQGIFPTQRSNPSLLDYRAGGFFPIWATKEAQSKGIHSNHWTTNKLIQPAGISELATLDTLELARWVHERSGHRDSGRGYLWAKQLELPLTKASLTTESSEWRPASNRSQCWALELALFPRDQQVTYWWADDIGLLLLWKGQLFLLIDRVLFQVWTCFSCPRASARTTVQKLRSTWSVVMENYTT